MVKALHLQCALSATTTALLWAKWYTPPQIHVCKCPIPAVTVFGGRALREVTGLNEVIRVGSSCDGITVPIRRHRVRTQDVIGPCLQAERPH